MTRTIWFSIDNMFKVNVSDNATDKEIWDAAYEKFQNILNRCDASDFDFIIEEDHTDP